MKNYDIAIASDHSGYLLKSKIIKYLVESKSLAVLDLGTHNSDEVVDYPDYAKMIVDSIIENTVIHGILICSTGIGMSIAANRRSEIKAALCFDIFMAERARLHYDANILVLGARISAESKIYDMVDKFLSTKFEGGRHSARLAKIT